MPARRIQSKCGIKFGMATSMELVNKERKEEASRQLVPVGILFLKLL
jgi:hypothetical protein